MTNIWTDEVADCRIAGREYYEITLKHINGVTVTKHASYAGCTAKETIIGLQQRIKQAALDIYYIESGRSPGWYEKLGLDP